jgi:hypothetical protein
MSDVLQRRARQVQQRRAVLAWEYRQRNHSKGVWFRLRRVLVDAERAWSISDAEADALAAEGYAEIPVGKELQPAKRMFFVPAERVQRLSVPRELALRLSPELLASANIVLVPLPGVRKNA